MSNVAIFTLVLGSLGLFFILSMAVTQVQGRKKDIYATPAGWATFGMFVCFGMLSMFTLFAFLGSTL